MRWLNNIIRRVSFQSRRARDCKSRSHLMLSDRLESTPESASPIRKTCSRLSKNHVTQLAVGIADQSSISITSMPFDSARQEIGNCLIEQFLSVIEGLVIRRHRTPHKILGESFSFQDSISFAHEFSQFF